MVKVKVKKKTEDKKTRKVQQPTFFKFTGLDKVEYRLTFQQKLFVESYLQMKGNGVEAIIEAGYDIWYRDRDGEVTDNPNRRLCAVMASENLTKPNICAYVTFMLEEYGFNDDNIAKQHLFLINQFDDLAAKRGGIDMAYKLKGKYAPEKVEFLDPNKNKSDEDLDEEERKLNERIRTLREKKKYTRKPKAKSDGESA